MADKDNTALFRNYAYIATFDSPPPKRQLLFWTFLEHSPETGKKILGWILFLLFVQKKKKASLKNTEINFVLFLQFKNVTEKV